ncbi:MAG TPA: molybdopterin-dependent oxidoreductase [Burkholderiaceae bacterium]|nr:molybdopterin-dependent oxidoreductase [Burkholderiaceae bacterium]
MKKRDFLAGAGGSLAAGALGAIAPGLARAAVPWQPGELPAGTLASATLEALPGKVPLIKRSYRPTNYETPIEYLRTTITPNNAFFVRWHLSGVPVVKLREWRLKIGGDAAGKPLEFDMARLRREFEQVELVAVCQCSGNRRGMFQPHVAGVEWGVGAMGNARWTGVRLRDVLDRAGVKAGAVEVAFNGADQGVYPATPDFVKSIPIDKARDEHTLIAFEMNGKPLPAGNGFPARVIVPGWTGTYWMKQLTDIDIRTSPQGGFWMTTAYRLPAGLFPKADAYPTQATAANTPITDIVVNSLVTSIHDGARVHRGQTVDVAGIAWDGGRGIRDVQVSIDAGQSWQPARLGRDLGRYSFREFSYRFRPERQGVYLVMVKASNTRGDTQTMNLVFNPPGYHHNVVERIQIEVV